MAIKPKLTKALLINLLTISISKGQSYYQGSPAPGRYKFNLTSPYSKYITIRLEHLENAGTRIDGNIHVYDDHNNFHSNGVRAYFNATFNYETDIKGVEGGFYEITIISDFYQKFRYDGLFGRESKQKDTPITFGFSNKNLKDLDNYFKAMEYFRIGETTYIFPEFSKRYYIGYIASITFCIISALFSCLFSLANDGKKQHANNMIKEPRNSGIDAYCFYHLSIPMFFLLARIFIQYSYLYYLIPPLVWFFFISFVFCFRLNGSYISKGVLGIISWISMGLGTLCFLLSFYDLQLAVVCIHVVFQLVWMIDFVDINKKNKNPNLVWRYLTYLILCFVCFYSGFYHTFFNQNTLRGYPINDNFSSLFLYILFAGIIINFLVAFFSGFVRRAFNQIFKKLKSENKEMERRERGYFEERQPRETNINVNYFGKRNKEERAIGGRDKKRADNDKNGLRNDNNNLIVE